jgi:competence protein ComFC
VLKSGFRLILHGLSDLFFPPACVLCDAPEVKTDERLCFKCAETIKLIPDIVCPKCGLPISQPDSAAFHPCKRERPAYGRARYGYFHEGAVRECVVGLKYNGSLKMGEAVSDLLIKAFNRYFRPHEFDLIIPVPVHRKRLSKRGFNQTVVVSQDLSDFTGIPLQRRALKKTRDTPPQVGLSRSQRMSNLAGSFGVKRPSLISRARILLIDDVSTTGSTIREASRALMDSGARSVDVLVLAFRTSAHSETSSKD